MYQIDSVPQLVSHIIHASTHNSQASTNSTSVRSRLNEQLSKLQLKHNAEVELMEDIKTFTKHRSVLDKQYAEVLDFRAMPVVSM